MMENAATSPSLVRFSRLSNSREHIFVPRELQRGCGAKPQVMAGCARSATIRLVSCHIAVTQPAQNAHDPLEAFLDPGRVVHPSELAPPSPGRGFFFLFGAPASRPSPPVIRLGIRQNENGARKPCHMCGSVSRAEKRLLWNRERRPNARGATSEKCQKLKNHLARQSRPALGYRFGEGALGGGHDGPVGCPGQN
jgi:hypothetical protein